MKPTVIIAGMLAAAAALPGCIVQEIRDELRDANGQLVCVQFAMEEANQGLSSANTLLAETNDRLDRVEEGLTRLDRTNALIDSVEKGLERIDSTNISLDGLQTQLALLNSIEQSLGRLDTHLASVRKTIGSINSFIPFLDLGGGYEETEISSAALAELPVVGAADRAPPAIDADGEPTAAGVGSVAASTTPAQQVAARRDSIMGAWISVYPDRSVALVIHADGTYERAWIHPAPPPRDGTGQVHVQAGPRTLIERGRWSREANTVRFVTEPAGQGGGQGAAGAGGSAAAATAAPAKEWVIKVLSITSRAMAIEETGGMVVFGRP